MTIEFDYAIERDYKEFYKKVCKVLNLANDLELKKFANLDYNADLLHEFLLNYRNYDLVFKFVGFDRSKLEESKSYNNAKWCTIFRVLEDLAFNIVFC